MPLVNFAQRVLTIFKRVGLPLLILTACSNMLEQYLTSKMESELGSLEGISAMIWIYGGLSVGLSLILPSLGVILSLAALKPDHVLTTLRTHWSAVFKESLRAAGNAMTWGLLLVIPGLIRFVQLSLVPFIVMLDPEYKVGHLDALKESSKIVNKRFIQVLCVIVIFTVILPILSSSFDEWSVFTVHPISATFLSFLDLLLSTLSFLFLLRQWEKQKTIM